MLPAPVAEQITARHALWRETARQRADLAAADAGEFAGGVSGGRPRTASLAAPARALVPSPPDAVAEQDAWQTRAAATFPDDGGLGTRNRWSEDRRPESAGFRWHPSDDGVLPPGYRNGRWFVRRAGSEVRTKPKG
ncbi:hypothetical protein GCM10010187_18150 [Actinomadura coerulea]|nr:hypothetical protein GCM10010187_18150 [Actinomadura coerulea]